MLSGLRLRLTGLYMMAALALLLLVGGGSYRLLDYYFRLTTDLALKHKMAHEFRLLGAPLPAELAAADQAWHANGDRLLPVNPATPVGGGPGVDTPADISNEEAYDGELAAIFTLPLSADGRLLFDPNPYSPPVSPDTQALTSALATGADLRTVRLADGTRVRLLTYRLTRPDGPPVLQLGRTLADQDRVLAQLLVSLWGFGGVGAVLLGVGSWWLAGRSVVPAQRAWEQQQTFVANASHELRAPLTLIRASVEVAARGIPDDRAQAQLLEDALQECDHMSRLVDDLLLLSRLDARQLNLERQTVSLPELLGGIQRQAGRLADERGIQLLTVSLAGCVWADPTRLRQVILILIDNALRHTPAGGTIGLETRAQGRQTQVVVSDTGPGIAPEHMPHVFERFYRAGGARNGGGGESSGLGLSIAKALVEAQHGQIRLESQPGKGTRVILSFPTATT